MLQSKSFRNGLGILSLVWVGVVLGVGCGGSAGNGDNCEGNDCPQVPGGSCTLNGVTYDDGDSVPSLDGCNSCGCVDGQIACTLVDCANDSCNYGGQVYADGDSFMSADGCNSCGCSDGDVICTERDCQPDPEPDPNTRSCFFQGEYLSPGEVRAAGDGCNTCSCWNGEMQCTLAYCIVNCFDDTQCADGMYCAYPSGSCGLYGAASGSSDKAAEAPESNLGVGMDPPAPIGECQSRPEICTTDDNPVCGCDGVTHGNTCGAAQSGVNVAHVGACN